MFTTRKKLISSIFSFFLVVSIIINAISVVEVSATSTPTVYLQKDEQWSDHPYGHKDGIEHTSEATCNDTADTDIGYSGCGVLAYVNAIYYLNGSFIEPTMLANYSIENGYRVCTVGTAASLYNGFAGTYGTTYGFQYGDKHDDVNFTTLRKHLEAGGVTVANVPGHFIAIVDYNADNETYLVLDSAPSTSRGTTANGDWKTQAQLSSGKLNVNYYLTFTSTDKTAEKTNPTTTFNTSTATYTLGDTYELTGTVNGDNANLKAVQVTLYGPDTKTAGIVLYRWEGDSASVSLENVVEFKWGDIVYRDSSLSTGTESLDTNMPGTYWIQVFATDINNGGFVSEKCKTVVVKNKASEETNWNDEYNPNVNSQITPELIQCFLESYSSGGLSKTSTTNGKTVLAINGTTYDLEFDSYYAHSNTITSTNPLSKESTAQTLTPAEIIYYACVENDMNVVWILSNLQKEQSLIGSVGSNYQTRLNRAVGYMKFTEGTRTHYEDGDKFYGFVGQTIAATYQFWSYANAGKTAEQAYDTSVLTLVSVEDTGLMPGEMHTTTYISPYTLTWENDTVRENYTVSGTLVNLTFTVSETAEPGQYSIKVTTPVDGIYNYDGENVDFYMVNGCVTVRDYIVGDVNGDGAVTNKDRLLLARYLAAWDGYDLSKIDQNAADINCDGAITNKDRLYLARHLAAWDGYETLPIT